jgi:hypothetical protein
MNETVPSGEFLTYAKIMEIRNTVKRLFKVRCKWKNLTRYCPSWRIRRNGIRR